MTAIEIAKLFIGEKEKPHNGGFYNEALQSVMTKSGHHTGEAWCCYFAESCFCEAVKGTAKEKELRSLFSANCVQTMKNFIKAGYKTSVIPVAGALVIYRRYVNGIPQNTGHAGICEVAVDDEGFMDIEGNTNRDGSSEGDSILSKARTTRRKRTGLNVEVFIIVE